LSKIEKGIVFGLSEMKNGTTRWEFWIALIVVIIVVIILYAVYGTKWFKSDHQTSAQTKVPPKETPSWYEEGTPDYWTQRDGYDYQNDDSQLPLEGEPPQLPKYDNKPLDTPRPNGKRKTEPPTTGKKRKCSKGEAIVRQTLEQHYNKQFPSTWPEFLRNPETNRRLELDCYNADLKIAAEYNGSQHYIWPNYTGQSYEQHIRQRRRDRYKVEVCDKLGITLIIIPYTVKHQFIPAYVKQRLPTTNNY